MKTKIFIASFVVVLLALIFAVPALARPDEPRPENVWVTLCHATNSETNPYNLITVNVNSVAVAEALHGHWTHQDAEDIIPLYTYDGVNYGPRGDQSVLENGCVVPGEDPEDPEDPNDPRSDPTPTTPYEPGTDITFDASVDPEVVRNADGDIVDAPGQCFRFDEDVTLVLFHYDGRNEVTGEFDGGPHTDWSQTYAAGSSLCHLFVGELTTPNSGNAFYMMTANGILLSINGDATYEGVTAADWDDGHAFNPVLSGVVAGELYTP